MTKSMDSPSGGKKQKNPVNVGEGVQMAGLPGFLSGSAVFLVHAGGHWADGLRAADAAFRVNSAAHPS